MLDDVLRRLKARTTWAVASLIAAQAAFEAAAATLEGRWPSAISWSVGTCFMFLLAFLLEKLKVLEVE